MAPELADQLQNLSLTTKPHPSLGAGAQMNLTANKTPLIPQTRTYTSTEQPYRHSHQLLYPVSGSLSVAFQPASLQNPSTALLSRSLETSPKPTLPGASDLSRCSKLLSKLNPSFLSRLRDSFWSTAHFTAPSLSLVSLNQSNFRAFIFPRGNSSPSSFFHCPSIISLSVPPDLFLLLQIQLKPLREPHDQVNAVTNGGTG